MPETEDEHELAFDSDSFTKITKQPRARWDDETGDPEATTYPGDEPGPSPVPDWVITSGDARQYELGVLKTGKEAEVFLVERVHEDRTNLLAAKRYRSISQRAFKRDDVYRQARKTGDSRLDRAMAKGTTKGMAFRALAWAQEEFAVLRRLWSAGVSVPYPVQLLGLELMLEYFGDEDEAAPRLVDADLDKGELEDLCGQAVDAMRGMVEAGIIHADLSPYNTLVWDDRLIVIDFPQAVDPVEVTDGLALLRRDVDNLVGWFARKGAGCDPDAVYDDLAALVTSRTRD